MQPVLMLKLRSRTLFATVLCAILLTSCATPRTAETPQSIALPKMQVAGVNYDDGISYDEAVALSSEYFRYYLGLCGMPDKPVESTEFWQTTLLRGIAGSYAGKFWIAKDGSKILIEPANQHITQIIEKRLQIAKSSR